MKVPLQTLFLVCALSKPDTIIILASPLCNLDNDFIRREQFFFVHHFVQRQMNHKQYYAFLSCYVSPYFFFGLCWFACKYGGYEFTKFKNINYSHMLLFFPLCFFIHRLRMIMCVATRTLRQLSQ